VLRDESLEGTAKYEDDVAGTTRLVLWTVLAEREGMFVGIRGERSSDVFFGLPGLLQPIQRAPIEEKIVPRGVHGFFTRKIR